MSKAWAKIERDKRMRVCKDGLSRRNIKVEIVKSQRKRDIEGQQRAMEEVLGVGVMPLRRGDVKLGSSKDFLIAYLFQITIKNKLKKQPIMRIIDIYEEKAQLAPLEKSI